MSNILFLASDYIERMANPVYGTSTNEEYAMKLATLLRSEGFEARLNKEISGLRDPTTLTSYGWLWLFEWARSRNIDLNDDLLVALYEEWSSVFVRVAIIDLATRNVANTERNSQGLSVQEFPNKFLARIMSRATRPPETDPTPGPEGERVGRPEQSGRRSRDEQEARKTEEEQRASESGPSTAMAESTLVALLQVDSPITREAAKVLLRHNWHGQAQVLEGFRSIYQRLDQETQDVWTRLLDPPRQAGPRSNSG